MRTKIFFSILVVAFCACGVNTNAQSFVKVYNDLHSDYFGFNVVPSENKQTAVLGYFSSGEPFTKIVDSLGNTKYTNTNYPYIGYHTYSNLTGATNGYVFFNGYGFGNMGNPNYENLDFINDTLNSIINYSYYLAGYASSDYIKLNNVIHNGLFFTCTCWTHSIAGPFPKYSATFISKYDSVGNQLWNNSFGPSDSANQCQVFYSIITSDSGFAVMGLILDTMHLKKYDFNGNLLFDHEYSIFFHAPHSNTYNFNCNLLEVNNNILAFSNSIDTSTNKHQLATEIINLNDSLISKKKYILNKDTADITPRAVYQVSDTAAIINYSILGSSLNYYLILDFKGDSLGSFILPHCSNSCFDNGNVICVLDTTGAIIVREYAPQGAVLYKYVYTPAITSNVCYAISPLSYPGRFVLTGSANNNLLIIRQDTGYINPGITSLTNLSCNGSNNGSASISVAGGVSPYTYLWNPSGGTNFSASGLSAGSYTVNVSDNAGNSNNIIINITQPAILNNKVTTTNSNCLISTGTIKDSAFGGTQPYTYLWSNGRTNDTLINLSSGTYTCTITDSHGCTKTDSVYLEKGPTASITYTNVVCNGANTGSATVSLAGNYAYSWSPNGGTESYATGLSAGTYTVNLTNIDTLGCNQVYSLTLTQAAPISATFTVNSTTCSAYQTIDVKVAGGNTPPYTYRWSYGGTGTTASITVSCQLGYIADTLFVIDIKGCIAPEIVNLQSPIYLTGTTPTYESCFNGNNGTIIMEVCGGTLPYTYYWPSHSSVSNNSTFIITGLSAGLYNVGVSDSNACNTGYVNVIITQPNAINISSDSVDDSGGCNGSAWVHISGGTSSYTYSWTGGLTTDTIFNQCSGDYCCIVTDGNGCIDSICVTIPLFTGTNQLITNNEELRVYPNPNNGVFTIALSHAETSSGQAQKTVEIYNVWGEMVETQCIASLQTTIELSNQPNGIYFYRVFDDKEILGSGKIIIEK